MIVTAVVLAAGSGSRLGRGPKALLPFRGRPLVEHIAGALREGGCDDVVVILGAEAEKVRAQSRLEDCTVLENPDWATGMASSFKTGIATAQTADAVVVALVDQPHISPELLRHLLQAHRPGKITAARYGDARRPSHPMIFDTVLAHEAAALAQDDAGARTFLRQNLELVDLVDCTRFGDGNDIDSNEDLHLLDS